MTISVIASSLACALTTYVYYNFYVSEAKSQLKTIVELQADYENWENETKTIYSVNKILSASKYSMRFTIINIDGEVIYDNWAKDDILENHKDRPEIAQAFNKGTGEYTRYSDTFATNMYYYAYKINDDEVLRISREISSINSVFLSITPMLFVLFAVLLVVSLLVYLLRKFLDQ